MNRTESKATKKYSILVSPPDFVTYEPYEDFEKHLLEVWKSASTIFAKIEFKYGQDTITITTNWSKFKPQFKYEIEKQDELVITVQGNATLIESFSAYFIIRFIEMMFITMNIAVPGSFNIFNEELVPAKKDPRLSVNTEVSLSSSIFETFWESCGELNHWPPVTFLPFVDVVEWYKSLDIMLKAKATTNIERCLFSLINFAKADAPFSPASLIWITHSLEALYRTPKEGILNSLRNRLFLFLGEPATHKNELKKKINTLYDLRSQFVHGSMEVAREPFFENIDIDLHIYMKQVVDMCDFGIMLLLATLQKLVVAKGKELTFSEGFEIK